MAVDFLFHYFSLKYKLVVSLLAKLEKIFIYVTEDANVIVIFPINGLNEMTKNLWTRKTPVLFV
jgi:hypothetical protein